MKKLYFSIAMMAAVSSFAQQISNGGFENWSGTPRRPTGWVTVESLSGGQISGLSSKDSVAPNFTEGLAAIRLNTDSVAVPGQGTNLIPGFVSYGSGNASLSGINLYGVPFTNRPDTLRFSYKYAGAGTDSALLELYIQKWNTTTQQTDILAGGGLLLGNTGNFWGNVFIPLDYTNQSTPDTLSVILSSSGNKPQKGSVARFDNIRFSYKTTTGIQDVALEYADITMYPNPTTDRITFKTAKDLSNLNVRIYALNGELVSEQKLSNNSANVSSLGAGTYIFELLDNTFSAVKGKFNVVR